MDLVSLPSAGHRDFAALCWVCAGLASPADRSPQRGTLRAGGRPLDHSALLGSSGAAGERDSLLCSPAVSSRQNLALGSSVLASVQAI